MTRRCYTTAPITYFSDTIVELKCASDNTLRGWTGCLETINRQLDWAARNSSDQKLIGNLCCVYGEATECIKTNTATVPSCNPKADTSKFLLSSMDAVLKEVLDYVCGKYQHKDDCAKHNPEGVQQLKLIAENDRREVEGPILIAPILQAVNRLSSDDEEASE